MLNILIALIALLWAQPAEAQSFPKPPDVPAYVTVTPTYASGTTLNLSGNGSANAGVPPAYAYELAEVAPVTESGWWTGTSEQCLAGNDGPGGLCPEAKFRGHIGAKVKILYDDPIRNYGQPGQAHCHMFWGNLSTNAYSTYASLRRAARDQSQASGGPANGTGYWSPCMMKLNPFGDGKDYILKPAEGKHIVIYYANDPIASPKMKRLLLGLRYVGGYDMDSGGDHPGKSNYMQSLVNTANAQPGTAGRYSVCNGSFCAVEAVYKCSTTDGSGEMQAHSLKLANGSDPFGGHCRAGDDLWIQFAGPTCWDGVNLWSPGGYKHVIPGIYDSVKGGFTCPNGWYSLPAFIHQLHYKQNGPSDYMNWVLSSDIAAGKTSTPGITYHTDWFNGWDRTVLTHWLEQCLGIEGGTARECGDNSTNVEKLVSTAPGPTGRTPVTLGTASGTDSPSNMFLAPSSSNGPKDIHVHGG